METKLFQEMSNEEYHLDKDTVSKSGLWTLINEGAKKFKYKVIAAKYYSYSNHGCYSWSGIDVGD